MEYAVEEFRLMSDSVDCGSCPYCMKDRVGRFRLSRNISGCMADMGAIYTTDKQWQHHEF